MFLCVVPKITKIIIAANIKIAIGIHKGENTHHQDHDITSVSFNTKKTRNKIVKNETPVPFILLLFLLFFLSR